MGSIDASIRYFMQVTHNLGNRSNSIWCVIRWRNKLYQFSTSEQLPTLSGIYQRSPNLFATFKMEEWLDVACEWQVQHVVLSNRLSYKTLEFPSLRKFPSFNIYWFLITRSFWSPWSFVQLMTNAWRRSLKRVAQLRSRFHFAQVAHMPFLTHCFYKFRCRQAFNQRARM